MERKAKIFRRSMCMFGINRVCVALGSRKCVVRWEKKMNDEPDVQLEPLKTIELN